MRSPLQRIRVGAFILLLLIAGSVLAYHLAGRDWLDSLYMVVITISSVGYAEKSSLPPSEKYLTMAVIVLGISAAAFTLGGFIQMMIEGELDRALSSGRSTRSIDRLKQHVIICGFGRVGKTLAEQLKARRQAFVIIDISPRSVAAAQSMGFLAFQGDATEESVLRQAGVGRAKCLVTALASDASNVFITLTSRNLHKDLQIIARGESPATEKKLVQAGATRVVMPAALGAMHIASMIVHPSVVDLMELVADQSVLDLEVDELTVVAGHKLVGKSIQETEARGRHGLLVVAAKKSGENLIFNPDNDWIFQEGDVVIVMGKVSDIRRFREDYEAENKPPVR